MLNRLQIDVLGALESRLGGTHLPLPQSKKTRALLTYLAVVGRPVQRDHLCRMLWDIPDDPRASLRWSLHKIRRVIANTETRLTANRESVVLEPSTLEVDFRRLASLCRGEIEALGTAELEELAAAFRGEFLENLSLPHCPSFEAWRIYHRDVAAGWRVKVLTELVFRCRATPEKALFYTHSLESIGVKLGRAATKVRVTDTDAKLHKPKVESSVRPPLPETSHGKQEIRFCRTPDGVRVAYGLTGDGAPIVRAAHWMSHLQYDWESPIWRHWIDALSDGMQLTRYDERGNGLSDWHVPQISFAEMVADLESVVDAAGRDRFTLLGVSQSCAVAVAYAVKHPERVSGLVLYGGFVRGWRKRSDDHEIATHEAMTTLIREGWGKNNPVFRRLFTTMFIPGASEEQMTWFDELQRQTVSPTNACRLHEAFGQIDVSELLSEVRVPTLVLHARQDAAVPFHSGREFATGILAARFVDLNSSNHILLESEPAFAMFVDEVRKFVAATI